MPQITTLDKDITEEQIVAFHTAAYTADPDYVYLVHSYVTDDWEGAGTPYRTFAAALASFIDGPYDGLWIDAAELTYPDGKPAHDTPGALWWPLYDDGEKIHGSNLGDNHPYIEKARVRG